jgi:hypothetical protein
VDARRDAGAVALAAPALTVPGRPAHLMASPAEEVTAHVAGLPEGPRHADRRATRRARAAECDQGVGSHTERPVHGRAVDREIAG